MSLGVEMITLDTVDPDRLAGWWATVLDVEPNPLMPGEFVRLELPSGPALGFQRVEDPTPGKNRVHIDLTASDLESEVERLVALGATETARHNVGDDFRWVVLADLDGNAFCVGAG